MAIRNPFRLIDKRSIIIILGAAALVTLISVIGIVLGVSSRNRRTMMDEEQRLIREREVLSRSTDFDIEDFFRDIRNPREGVTYSPRPKRPWRKSDVDFYWIDPAEAGIESLSADNDEQIRRSLEQGTGMSSP